MYDLWLPKGCSKKDYSPILEGDGAYAACYVRDIDQFVFWDNDRECFTLNIGRVGVKPPKSYKKIASVTGLYFVIAPHKGSTCSRMIYKENTNKIMRMEFWCNKEGLDVPAEERCTIDILGYEEELARWGRLGRDG